MAINWTQVNFPTILAVAGTAWGIITYINGFDKRLTESESYRVMRSSQTDQNFLQVNRGGEALKAELQSVRSLIQDLPFRVGSVENGLKEQGLRTDRLSELIVNNMEGFRKDMAGLGRELAGFGTKIEVLSSRIDDRMPRQKTQLLLDPYPVPPRGVPVDN